MKPLKAEVLVEANQNNVDIPPGIHVIMSQILSEVQKISGNGGSRGVPLAVLAMLGGDEKEFERYCKLADQNYDVNPRPISQTVKMYINNPQLRAFLESLDLS